MKQKHLTSSNTLKLFVIIHQFIAANAVGLVVGPTCIPFEDISSHPDTFEQLHQVGWIKVMSCVESLWTAKG